MQTENAKRATIQQRFEDLGEYAEAKIAQWPKMYRFTRGARMIDMMDEIAVLLEMAQRKYRVITSLHEADARLAALFRLLRRSNRTTYTVTRKKGGAAEVKRLIDDHSYGVWAEKMIEIGKMLGGWIKAADARRNGSNGEKP